MQVYRIGRYTDTPKSSVAQINPSHDLNLKEKRAERQSSSSLGNMLNITRDQCNCTTIYFRTFLGSKITNCPFSNLMPRD